MIKGVIFDLDGVIVSTDHFHFLAWKKLADRIGIYFDEKINERLRGVSRKESLEIILEKAACNYSEDEKNKFLEEKNNYYIEYIDTLDSSSVDKMVLTILDYLESKNVMLAIGSSSKNTIRILTKIGLIDRFKVIVDGTMINNSKPDPEVFLKAASLLDLNVNECLVVEDAKSGIDAAYRGGFMCLGIKSAYEYEYATYSDFDLEIDKIKFIIEGEKYEL